MFARKKNTKYVVRPTILGIFLAFNLLQFGIFLIAQSSFNLAYTKVGKLANNEFKNADPQEFEILQQQVQKTINSFQEEFSLERLVEEMDSAHLMRDQKIHYIAAFLCGLLSVVIAFFAILIFAKTWRSSWTEIRQCNSQMKIVFKVSFTSKLISWVTIFIGTTITFASALALRKLIYYRDEAWFTAFMNYESMTHLASHYNSTLTLGIICLLWGIFSVIFHWRKSTI
ncbi:hypothetical protein [Candidatus Uabimicrobium sp. HlEnr_7]|uniref:hypothetical protein n=1 Tax=Candidatus Uabimicrobium helgolandensis TaxID=3095367 RepID=UPI0035570698